MLGQQNTENFPRDTHSMVYSTCLLFIVTLGLFGCGEQSNDVSSQAQPEDSVTTPPLSREIQAPSAAKDPIQTTVVTTRDVQEQVSAPGEVALDLKHIAKISSRIRGQVEQVFVQLGERVAIGQQLVAIGSLQLDELVHEYLVAKVQGDVAENSFRRTKTLHAEQIVSERRMVEERGKYIEAKSKFQHVREKLLNMGLDQKELHELERGSHSKGHHYILKSPLNGTVVTQNVVLGQGVSPGVELLEVVDTNRVWIFANLPLEQARQFQSGDQGIIVSKGREPIEATLSYIAPIAEKVTRTVRIRFDVDNRKGLLKPNEYVEVRLRKNSSPTLAIPLSAVTMIEGVKGVFIQGETGFVFTPVEVGRQGEGLVEVKQGLHDGAQVVVSGVFDLKNALLQDTIEGD